MSPHRRKHYFIYTHTHTGKKLYAPVLIHFKKRLRFSVIDTKKTQRWLKIDLEDLSLEKHSKICSPLKTKRKKDYSLPKK